MAVLKIQVQRITYYHCHLYRCHGRWQQLAERKRRSAIQRPSRLYVFCAGTCADTRSQKCEVVLQKLCRSKGPALTCAFPVSLVLYVFMYVLFALIADHTRPTQHPHKSPCFLLLSFTCNIQSASTVGSHDPRTTGSHRRQAAMAHICFLLFALFSSLLLLLAGVCSPPSCSCP